MRHHPVVEVLGRWEDRRAILADARAEDPSLDLIAVHRWVQRRSVPPRYWQALIAGASRRGLGVTAEDLARAHARAIIDAEVTQ